MKTLMTLLATAIMVNWPSPGHHAHHPPKPQPKSTGAKGNRLGFRQNTAGRPVTHEFVITNTSSDSLKLDDVRAARLHHSCVENANR